MSYNLKLEIYEGPLDLLLQLIEKQELNIYDIPIAQVTEQYLEYLRAMEEFNLEIASDFLVMAATLLAIKSQMLLPKKNSVQEEEGDDPREELVTRLLEYKKYKQLSKELAKKLKQMENYFTPEIDRIGYASYFASSFDPLEGVNLDELVLTFKRVLLRAEEGAAPLREIERKNISIVEKMAKIKEKLDKDRETLKFDELLEGDAELPSLSEIVVTFMALLELVHRGQVHIYQKQLFGFIFIANAKD